MNIIFNYLEKLIIIFSSIALISILMGNPLFPDTFGFVLFGILLIKEGMVGLFGVDNSFYKLCHRQIHYKDIKNLCLCVLGILSLLFGVFPK